ncbi:MAG: patatin-like protein [Paracoccus aminovorans]|nr:patatin-like protein [Paracoccus aminovorans]
MVEEATGEVRFAVVLYGGVSLAIYMNGIAQELLRMVRGSSNLPDTALDEGERIYRDLSRALAGPRGGRKRFVIDIISGTSAGGINGVALAKALVVGSRDMAVLRKAWTVDADIDKLLNDGAGTLNPFAPTESLLDGAHMYDVLLETIAAIRGDDQPLAEMVDLFVTATDLRGVPAPIHLTGARLEEKVHKTVFHFAFEQERHNDFTPDNDAMLAFAARCTSSFPVAFPPMRFADMPHGAKDQAFSRFFRKGLADYDQRIYADGGYLDNRPFSHAIDLIPFRPTTLPGERKLLFIDPFPAPRPERDPATGAVKPQPPEPVDFLQNARLAASTLPRTEVIRDDIRAITRMNNRLERLGTLQARWKQDKGHIHRSAHEQQLREKPRDLTELDLADLLTGRDYGDSYALYHHLRVYDTTDSLTAIVARLAGYAPDSDEALYLRQILRAWRDRHFSAYREDGRETENAFLSRYDIGFRLRRLIHLRRQIDDRLDADSPPAPQSPALLRAARKLVERELVAVRRLANPRGADAEKLLTPDEIARLTAEIAAHYSEAMQQPTLERRYGLARRVYELPAIRPLVDRALRQLGTDMRREFDKGSARIREGLHDLPDILADYEDFHWHDVMTYPFLEGSDVQEHAQVEVFRISPADSALNPRPAKLAGIAVGAFGGFLNRDWREHDILWGRLDGAERIVAALMSDRTPEERQLWTDRLQNRILAEEYADKPGQTRRLALLKAKLRDAQIDEDAFEDTAARALGVKDAPALDLGRFRDNYSELKPIGPRAPQIAGWSSRSMAILSRMIDDLPDDGILGMLGARAAAALRAGGGLISGFTRFAMPGSYRRMVADKLLYLAMFAGLLVGFLGWWTGSDIARAGWLVLVLSVAVWLVLYCFGRWLRGRGTLPQALRWFLGLIAIGLMATGLVTVAKSLLG